MGTTYLTRTIRREEEGVGQTDEYEWGKHSCMFVWPHLGEYVPRISSFSLPPTFVQRQNAFLSDRLTKDVHSSVELPFRSCLSSGLRTATNH